MKDLLLHPHAKINLGLQILGIRSDGYHQIRTRFQTVSLTDEMEIEVTPGGVHLRVEGARLAGDDSNLVMRAAAALQEGREGLPGARIRLIKAIPLAAGLGGGSSDAAAALLGLDRLWALGLGPEGLRPIAASLGADIPFFLEGGTALGEGRGDEVHPLPDLSPYGICLVLAPFESSTADVYRRWDDGAASPVPAGSLPGSSFRERPGPETSWSVRNDLQDVVFGIHPELEGYWNLLYRSGAVAASLSGSGPTLFGLFETPEEARKFRISREWAPFRVVECVPVGRGDYPAALGLGHAAVSGTS